MCGGKGSDTAEPGPCVVALAEVWDLETDRLFLVVLADVAYQCIDP